MASPRSTPCAEAADQLVELEDRPPGRVWRGKVKVLPVDLADRADQAKIDQIERRGRATRKVGRDRLARLSKRAQR